MWKGSGFLALIGRRHAERVRAAKLDGVLPDYARETGEILAADLGDLTERGWSLIGEVPPRAGKLLSSVTFNGTLFLVFEHGSYYRDKQGRIMPVQRFAPRGGDL